jgi:hypothetical protein
MRPEPHMRTVVAMLLYFTYKILSVSPSLVLLLGDYNRFYSAETVYAHYCSLLDNLMHKAITAVLRP